LVRLVFLLTQVRLYIGPQGVRLSTNRDSSVLRGRALELIDEGQNVASINLYPANQATPGQSSNALS
jgi:hypothetical protein